jgi:hypothetical protein
VRRRGRGVFVAINFWDVLCFQRLPTIFNFGVVAISFFFALCFCFAVAVVGKRSLGSRYSLSGCRSSTDRHFFFALCRLFAPAWCEDPRSAACERFSGDSLLLRELWCQHMLGTGKHTSAGNSRTTTHSTRIDQRGAAVGSAMKNQRRRLSSSARPSTPVGQESTCAIR